MKLGFMHYTFAKDGVYTVVKNNIEGLQHLGMDNICLLAQGIDPSLCLPKNINTKNVNLLQTGSHAPRVIADQLHEKTRDLDTVIIENPTLGIFPHATLGFLRFARETNKTVVFRAHDLLHKRKEQYQQRYEEAGGNIDTMYPENTPVLALTQHDATHLHRLGVKDVHVLANSLNSQDFQRRHTYGQTRDFLHRRAGIPHDAHIVFYPGRLIPRKNFEHAIAYAKALEQDGKDAFFLSTLPGEEPYASHLKKYLQEINVTHAIGSFHAHLDRSSFTLADVYHASDYALTTSLNEGFGYNFLEPWLADVPILGRDLPDQTRDFQNSGLDLSHLNQPSFYEGFDFIPGYKKRMEFFRAVASRKQLQSFVADLESQKETAMSAREQNKQAILQQYHHVTKAQELLDIIAKYRTV
ncbi:MAG: glycosyltransferase [Candidatus Woesearchaeota archaeon]